MTLEQEIDTLARYTWPASAASTVANWTWDDEPKSISTPKELNLAIFIQIDNLIKNSPVALVSPYEYVRLSKQWWLHHASEY